MVIDDICEAIAREEGYYKPDSLPFWCNNPGDLELGDKGRGVRDGKTVFPTITEGWAALRNQVLLYLTGKSHIMQELAKKLGLGGPLDITLEEMGLKYSGGDPQWPINVADILGIPKETTLGALAQLCGIENESILNS